MPQPFDLPVTTASKLTNRFLRLTADSVQPLTSYEHLRLTTVVPHDVCIDNVPHIPKLVLQILPGCLPSEVADIAALANAHNAAVLAILVSHSVAA